MSSKKCCLRQHIRGEPANLTDIDLSLDNTVLKFGIRGPNILGSHIEEEFELFEIDETRPESGSLAILYTQNGFAFLEALTSDVSLESLGCNFDGVSAHTGMKVRPSTSGNMPSTLQLLPGQSFYIGKTTLSLVPEEHSDLLINASGLSDSNFESYNYQVSQMQSTLGPSTPQRTARGGSAVMETPMLYTDHDSDNFTSILKHVTGQAISGREDSKKWSESPLKREVMRTVREASEHGHSSSPPEFKKEDEHMADAAVDEPNCSSSQPEITTENVGMANTTAARPLGQGIVDLEDAEMASADLGSEYLGEPELFSSLKSRVYPEGGSGGSGRSPILKESKPLSSPVARVQPERGPEASDQSPILQAVSDSIQPIRPLDDDVDDTPVRKKAKTAVVSHETLLEESQDSLQNEVISVKRGIPTPTARPVSVEQASSSIPTRSGSANQHKQRSPTGSTRLKHPGLIIEPNPRPHPANQPPSKLSFSSTGSNTWTPPSDRNLTSASRSNSVEPNSSMRSTRSTARDEHNSSSFTDAGTRIVFASSSSAGSSKAVLKFLSNKGVKKVQSVHDCTVLCVGKELKKTSKLILAVLLGKDIITDSWVTDSVKGNDLLSVVPYIARDGKKEAEWGISLEEAIYRGKQGLRVLQDQTILFTLSAKKELGKNGFDELKGIVMCAGAKVSLALPKKSPDETSSTFVVAKHDETEVAALQKLGWRAYVKDIISLSILRGKLDLESDEFLIKEQKKEGRKRKR